MKGYNFTFIPVAGVSELHAQIQAVPSLLLLGVDCLPAWSALLPPLDRHSPSSVQAEHVAVQQQTTHDCVGELKSRTVACETRGSAAADMGAELEL